MESRKLTCINCPMGCSLEVLIDGKDITVKGNNCGRGYEYGQSEVTNPVRVVTTSVFVNKGSTAVVSVKTSKPVPKDKVFDIIKELAPINVDAPVKIGDVLVKNILYTGADIVATRNVYPV